MDPRRQHLIAALAVGAFFDSVLGPDAVTRAAAAEYLRSVLPRDFPEVRYAEARPTASESAAGVPR